jgi:hypothetical protein
MSERAPEHARLPADERYEIALATDAAARRNRPSHLVAVAGLVFIASCAALGFTSCRATQASQDLRRRADQRDSIAELLVDLEALSQSEDRADAAATEPYIGLRSKMEEIARQVGIEGALALPRERRSPDAAGAARVTYDYSLKGPTLGPLLAFVREAKAQVPGMRVAGVTLRPRNEQWEMEAKFERWERTASP